jgi:TonB family protein
MRLLLLALLLLAAPAAAQTPSASPPLIAKPQWLQRPTGDDVNAVYPVQAAVGGIGGQVMLTCQVGLDGGLTACSAEDFAPGYGFDKAALKLASRFRMASRKERGTVTIPLVFKPLVEGVPLYKDEIRDDRGERLGTFEWIGKPTGEDVNRHFPVEAIAKNAYGRVVLDCKVRGDGYVDQCKVVFENPPGLHYGDAALKLSTRFRLKATPSGDRPVVGGTVRVPLSFSPNE